MFYDYIDIDMDIHSKIAVGIPLQGYRIKNTFEV